MLPLFFLRGFETLQSVATYFHFGKFSETKVATTTHTPKKHTCINGQARKCLQGFETLLSVATATCFHFGKFGETKVATTTHTPPWETHTCQRARKTCIQTFVEYFFFVTFVFGIRCALKTCFLFKNFGETAFTSKTSVKLMPHQRKSIIYSCWCLYNGVNYEFAV